jgi:uncharacterized protein YqcC (DUF446 family)
MRPIEAPKCTRLLGEIELEMKREHVWQEAPLAPEKFIDMGPFGGNTMGFEQWLQFVFLPAVKEALAGEREPPKTSQVHIRAVREFDGQSDRDALVQLLCDFDETYMQEVASPSDVFKAAEQGNADAQYGLGWMYANGRGVAKDEKTAVLWYAKAAEQGHVRAQFNLAVMYADGRGVTQDIVSAPMWFHLAARVGDGAAVKRRDLAAAQMTPIQLSRAQDRAQGCINSNYKECD